MNFARDGEYIYLRFSPRKLSTRSSIYEHVDLHDISLFAHSWDRPLAFCTEHSSLLRLLVSFAFGAIYLIYVYERAPSISSCTNSPKQSYRFHYPYETSTPTKSPCAPWSVMHWDFHFSYFGLAAHRYRYPNFCPSCVLILKTYILVQNHRNLFPVCY